MSLATDTYHQWLNNGDLKPELRKELEEIKSSEEIEDRFYQDLEFGTGGLRGVLGAGTNRMNVYTVRKATLGLARYLFDKGSEMKQKGVVVGYDCRHMSLEFAEEIGLVLAAQGIRAYVFEHLSPTPEVSFAVRALGAAAGVMVTASHNPPEYNGYKVYGSDGCQLLPEEAHKIIDEVENISDIFSVPVAKKSEAEDQGLFRTIGSDIDKQYTTAVLESVQRKQVEPQHRASLRIVYTPLHGTGNKPIREVLQEAGYSQTSVVPEQEQPDGDFSTVESPNPEEPEALELGIQQGRREGADIVMGTDPDADRVGIAVRKANGEFELFTGNQVGGLLVDFVIRMHSEAGTLPKNGIVFKTIVTSELGAEVARQHELAVENTLTGFKYIGDGITDYEETGEHTFLFGYEESYGYLASDIVRDKDAVQTCLLIAEMAAYYKAQSKTLHNALEDLYQRVGYYLEELVSRKMPGADGMEKIAAILDDLRENGLNVSGLTLAAVEDYENQTRTEMTSGKESRLELPQANVLKYFFTDGSWLAVRPSGTEPKIKVYIGAKGDSAKQCEVSLDKLRQAVHSLLDK